MLEYAHIWTLCTYVCTHKIKCKLIVGSSVIGKIFMTTSLMDMNKLENTSSIIQNKE
jgi:hypothetical protein